MSDQEWFDQRELELLDDIPNLSSYALTGTARGLLRAGLMVSLTGAIALAICDPVLGIRLTIPALLLMSVANVCAASLIFARRFMPVHEAFRLGYKSGRADERRVHYGDADWDLDLR